ncbi:MAG: hypothetical protein IKF90_13630 [Parasporobacterium sp.]|nr:hypothetical protein [Parasporobacterium sp.]
MKWMSAFAYTSVGALHIGVNDDGYVILQMFWNVVKYAKQYGVQLRYFLYASAEKCAAQVVEADKR